MPSRLLKASACALIALAVACPARAQAHGPVNPVASAYLAVPTAVPNLLRVKVIDGDQRMWLSVPPGMTVVVLDYLGAPYLRFTGGRIEVNANSEMYYLNQTPVAAPVPAGLTRATRPDWRPVASARQYSWHDGRLHALAAVAVPPGVADVGQWKVPLLVNGRATAILGTLRHSGPPSIVWFWPIAVVLACVLAAWRVGSDRVDVVTARLLALAALAGTALAAIARGLEGRPTVGGFQLVELIAVLVFVAWGAYRISFWRGGYFRFFAIAVVALWEGVTLVPTLLSGFVLLALPAVVCRVASDLCLAGGLASLVLLFRLADRPGARARAVAAGVASAALLAGCGGEARPARGEAVTRTLVSQARPIGRGARFQPAARGPILGSCSSHLGARAAVHVEVFAENRVVVVPAGLGTLAPRKLDLGRISRARCYGALVTLEPTGVALLRPGVRLSVSSLFAEWGQPLSDQRVSSFAAPPGGAVTAFVDGRRWRGPVGRIPLKPHAEVVLEVGPFVAPHSTYLFPPGT